MLKRADMALSSTIRAPQNSRGFIVVAVLWIVAALATLASIYALYVRDTAAAFVGHDDRLEAKALAMAGVELAVATVSVDVPEPLIDAGLKLAPAPEGNPLAPSDTLPVKPFCGLTDTV